MNRYTFEEIEYIKDNIHLYKNGIKFEYDRFIDDFNTKFERDLTQNKLHGILTKRKIKLGKPNWNLINGLKAQSNYKIGDERTTGRYTFVKVNENYWEDCWKPKHVIMYEKHHNIKIEDGEYVSFLDRNTKNFDIDNLVLLSQKGLGKMSKYNHINNIEIRKTAYTICKTECILEEIMERIK